jgi:hypothetical protein
MFRELGAQFAHEGPYAEGSEFVHSAPQGLFRYCRAFSHGPSSPRFVHESILRRPFRRRTRKRVPFRGCLSDRSPAMGSRRRSRSNVRLVEPGDAGRQPVQMIRLCSVDMKSRRITCLADLVMTTPGFIGLAVADGTFPGTAPSRRSRHSGTSTRAGMPARPLDTVRCDARTPA